MSATVTTPAIEAPNWHSSVMEPAGHSTRLVFVLCAAFAAPLCRALGVAAPAFHLWGPKDSGRVPALWLAAAIHGPVTDLRSWDELAAEHSRIFAERRDGPLLLHNFDGLNPVAQTLAAVRACAKRSGAAVDPPLMLSEGERPFEQSKALRLASNSALFINVPADAGCDSGVFEDFAMMPPELRVAGIAREALALAGVVGAVWRQRVAELVILLDAEIAAGRMKSRDEWLRTLGPAWPEDRWPFYLLAVAGELARSQGMTAWAPGHAAQCVARCAEASLFGAAR